MSKGWVTKAEGGGAGEGDVLAALVAMQDALLRAELSASDLFSNFNPSFLKMGQSRVLWSVLHTKSWQKKAFTFVLRQGFPPMIEMVVEWFCCKSTIWVCCVWVDIGFCRVCCQSAHRSPITPDWAFPWVLVVCGTWPNKRIVPEHASDGHGRRQRPWGTMPLLWWNSLVFHQGEKLCRTPPQLKFRCTKCTWCCPWCGEQKSCPRLGTRGPWVAAEAMRDTPLLWQNSPYFHKVKNYAALPPQLKFKQTKRTWYCPWCGKQESCPRTFVRGPSAAAEAMGGNPPSWKNSPYFHQCEKLCWTPPPTQFLSNQEHMMLPMILKEDNCHGGRGRGGQLPCCGKNILIFQDENLCRTSPPVGIITNHCTQNCPWCGDQVHSPRTGAGGPRVAAEAMADNIYGCHVPWKILAKK